MRSNIEQTHFYSEYVETGVPFYRSKEIIESSKGQLLSEPLFISQEKYDEIKDKFGVPVAGDMLLTSVGTIGVPYIVKKEDRFYFKDGNLTWFRNFSDKLYSKYLYYWISSKDGYGILNNTTIGSSQKALTISALKNIEIPLPPYKTQIRIADALSAYDSLIENNQKQIKLLEEAAQRLYKEWFVDLRFPGYEDTEIVGGIPAGWAISTLSVVAELKAGGDKPKVFSETLTTDNSVPVYANGITEKGLCGFTNKAVIEKPSITISARGTVGVVFLRRQPYMPIVRLISITPNDDIMDALYLYLYSTNQSFISTGAAQQQITVPLLKDKAILCPTDKIRKSFYKIVLPLFDKIDNLEKQIAGSKQARDRLLPKLMSEELEV